MTGEDEFAGAAVALVDTGAEVEAVASADATEASPPKARVAFGESERVTDDEIRLRLDGFAIAELGVDC